MIVWKAWFDIRQRFWIALGIACLAAIATVAAWANLDWIVSHLDLTPEDVRELSGAASDYRTWITSTWIAPSGGGLLGYLAILIALGGVLTEKRDGALEITLSLPVAPARWVAAHAGVVITLTLAISGTATAILVGGGAVIGAPYPIGAAIADTLRMTIGIGTAIGITLFLGSLTRSALTTAVIAVPTVFLLHQPVGALVVPLWGHAALGAVGVALSIVVFSRTDL